MPLAQAITGGTITQMRRQQVGGAAQVLRGDGDQDDVGACCAGRGRWVMAMVAAILIPGRRGNFFARRRDVRGMGRVARVKREVTPGAGGDGRECRSHRA